MIHVRKHVHGVTVFTISGYYCAVTYILYLGGDNDAIENNKYMGNHIWNWVRLQSTKCKLQQNISESLIIFHR